MLTSAARTVAYLLLILTVSYDFMTSLTLQFTMASTNSRFRPRTSRFTFCARVPFFDDGFPLSALCPVGTVAGAVLDGFGEVFGFDGGGAVDVGDGAGDFQDAIVGAGAQALLRDGAFEEAFAVGG